mmetsp:Transcript_20492/g.15117  ORF Transcript_20492/g.15117 Transcript_20492/m.15117 type:complete len:122 (-) Transcript_20492:1096-1461(-)
MAQGHPGGLSLFAATLTFLSTIVGGGIVGIPYAFYYCGILFGTVLNFIVMFLTVASIWLYCLAKDLTDNRQSYEEIGYLAWGKASIYLINFMFFFNAFGLTMVYFIVFSSVAANLVVQAII